MEKPYTPTHCVLFDRMTGRPERMERAAARERVKADPSRWSYDSWRDVQDIGSRHEIPANWCQMSDSELRELHRAMRLPAGSKWSTETQSGGHIANVTYDVERRFSRREGVALGIAR